jgi:polar amino acid transport system substrate-binding protein
MSDHHHLMKGTTMRKLLTSVSGALLALTALSACGSDSDASATGGDCTPAHEGLKTVSPGTLTAATYNFPPFVKLDGTNASGVEGEILQEIASMECMTLTAQPLDTGSVISATQSGRTDIAAGNWYCTQEREDVMSLAGPVYGDQIGLISTDGSSTFDDLTGKAMGSVDGYLWNEEFKSIYGSDLKLYPNPTAMYNDLKSGRLDVAADSFGSATYANEQNGNEWQIEVPEADDRVASSQAPPQVCFPMSKDNEELYEAVTEDLEKLREDGTIADILESNELDPSAADSGELRLIS